jgi:hypothetical protein
VSGSTWSAGDVVIDYDWGGGEVTGSGWLVVGWLVVGALVVGSLVVGSGEGDCGAGGVGGREEGATGDDGLDGAVDVGGQLVEGGAEVLDGDGVPVLALGEEAQGVGVDTLADGVRFTGGSVLWSWWPVSPRCRPIHS